MKPSMRFASVTLAFLAALLFVAVSGMNVVEAQGIGSGAGCTITSDVAVSSGSAVKLLYEVQNRPSSITISATDSAANPSGTPTVGTPDPNRADGTAVGNIMTGSITKDVTFTMTVTNSRGSSTCKVKIYYKARPASGWQVPLVRQEPVFSRLQIPGGFDTSFGDWPFHTAYWLSGGYFVVNGSGNSGAGLGTAPVPLRTAANRFEAGGMYVFREDGTLAGVRDVVYDTSIRAAACFEGGGCRTGDLIHSLGTGRFVRDLKPSRGFSRGPVIYSISGASINMDQRLFFNDRGGGNESVSGDPVDRLSAFGNIAVAGGKIIGVAERHSGNAGPYYQVEIYDLNFNRLAKFGSGGPLAQAELYPVVGVGDYIFARPGSSGSSGPLKVYKMPTNAELAQGQRPPLVQTLPDGLVRGYAVDAANPNRVAIFWIPRGRSLASEPTMTIYQVGPSGLTQASERKLGQDAANATGLLDSTYALSGDYLAYGSCPNGATGNSWTGNRGGYNFDGCQLVVEKISGEKLATEPLPKSRYSDFGLENLGGLIGESQAIGAVAISPGGRIMVTTGAGPNSGGGDNGNVYLYQIGGAQSGPGTPPPSTPPVPPSSTVPQYVGQTFNITYSTTSASRPPEVLIRISTVLSVGSSSLSISTFGRTYTIDASRAEIVGSDWAPVSLSTFRPYGFANVWGTLDLADPTLIHAARVRNPSPADAAAAQAAVSKGLTPGSLAAPAPISSATQVQLNALQEALRALQLRLAR